MLVTLKSIPNHVMNTQIHQLVTLFSNDTLERILSYFSFLFIPFSSCFFTILRHQAGEGRIAELQIP